jgi:hypothetical protein
MIVPWSVRVRIVGLHVGFLIILWLLHQLNPFEKIQSLHNDLQLISEHGPLHPYGIMGSHCFNEFLIRRSWVKV